MQFAAGGDEHGDRAAKADGALGAGEKADKGFVVFSAYGFVQDEHAGPIRRSCRPLVGPGERAVFGSAKALPLIRTNSAAVWATVTVVKANLGR